MTESARIQGCRDDCAAALRQLRGVDRGIVTVVKVDDPDAERFGEPTWCYGWGHVVVTLDNGWAFEIRKRGDQSWRETMAIRPPGGDWKNVDFDDPEATHWVSDRLAEWYPRTTTGRQAFGFPEPPTRAEQLAQFAVGMVTTSATVQGFRLMRWLGWRPRSDSPRDQIALWLEHEMEAIELRNAATLAQLIGGKVAEWVARNAEDGSP